MRVSSGATDFTTSFWAATRHALRRSTCWKPSPSSETWGPFLTKLARCMHNGHCDSVIGWQKDAQTQPTEEDLGTSCARKAGDSLARASRKPRAAHSGPRSRSAPPRGVRALPGVRSCWHLGRTRDSACGGVTFCRQRNLHSLNGTIGIVSRSFSVIIGHRSLAAAKYTNRSGGDGDVA